ncbi:hypothetical protein K461DRAFT_84315 [Myriangium duriaei CBS 260.36]|uniref:Uncharacterized protein n=1 Tax=Myriangium duriaei CBS 260.36 TaxID=1168546 RepID=A0A9P4J5R9_9PEZI|nr:hypothetical protein K461DRAFT_84315 [Myriangium duriaei CBS 260.36]
MRGRLGYMWPRVGGLLRLNRGGSTKLSEMRKRSRLHRARPGTCLRLSVRGNAGSVRSSSHVRQDISCRVGVSVPRRSFPIELVSATATHLHILLWLIDRSGRSGPACFWRLLFLFSTSVLGCHPASSTPAPVSPSLSPQAAGCRSVQRCELPLDPRLFSQYR